MARDDMAKHAEIIEKKIGSAEELIAEVDDVAGIVVPYTEKPLVTREVIDRASKLRIIGSTYGGTRQNIDDIYALSKGITLVHTGASRPRPMAEYTLALVLSSLLRIHNFHHDMVSGEAWPRTKYGRSRILQNRSVGVIGMGRIGRAIVDLFKCFTSDISVHSNHMGDVEAKTLGVKNIGLDEIFSSCEIQILAGGYTPKTRHLIGAKQFACMKSGALFVNIARGGMVDQTAMIDAVDKRPIFLALDVFDPEPLEADSPLRKNDRVLLVPHRANNSIEFEERWKCLAGELNAYFEGRTPGSALTLERAVTMSES